MKYIDAERLRAEIERMQEINRKALESGHIESGVFHGRAQTLNYIFEFIDSLQKEQSDVGLEKEIDAVWNPRFNLGWDEKSLLSINRSAFETIARHFYELGKNARKV